MWVVEVHTDITPHTLYGVRVVCVVLFGGMYVGEYPTVGWDSLFDHLRDFGGGEKTTSGPGLNWGNVGLGVVEE